MSFSSPEYSKVFRIFCYFFLQKQIWYASSSNFGVGASAVFEWFHHISFYSHFWCSLRIIFCPCYIKYNCDCFLILDNASLFSAFLQVICSSSGHLIEQTHLLCQMMAQAFSCLSLVSRLFTAAMLDAVILTLLGFFLFVLGFFCFVLFYFAALLSCWNYQLISYVS